MGEPFQNEVCNLGEYFTCPGCYTDFPKPEKCGVFKCDGCDRMVDCRIEMIPQYKATLMEEKEK